jgi:hypothetical protein
MASALSNPLEATVGAAVGAGTGSLSGATWLASELAKLGRYLAGAPGELSAAMLGASAGAAAGAAVGATLGALSGRLMLQYVAGGELAARGLALADVFVAPLDRLLAARPPGLDGRPRGGGEQGTPPTPPAALVPAAPSPFPGEPIGETAEGGRR